MDSPDQQPSSALDKYRHLVQVKYQKFLDDSIPYLPVRWASTFFILTVYLVRVYSLGGWYIVTYALGIYLLNLLIGFLSPQWDPETEETDSLGLPTKGDDEFKPFVRKLPEFKFWYSVTRAMVIALFCTFFSFLDIPVFWPILLIYFIALFTVTMKKQIKHMMKHKYIPFTTGKPKYQGGK